MNLETILKGVSRSFYLSLHYLPASLRSPMKLAFLYCKAADTIADTSLIARDKRLYYLERFRTQWEPRDDALAIDLQRDVAPIAENGSEQDLLNQLSALNDALNGIRPDDRARIISLVSELTQGMITDLNHFPGETAGELSAFHSAAELDDYTYYVAGCVGRFWTRMLGAHCRFAKEWNQEQQETIGETFGKGLQMVNILRDLPHDLRRGRCYLPSQALSTYGLEPQDLLQSSALPRVRPYFQELMGQTRQKLLSAIDYTAAHPWYALRLKWVVLVPMQLGFQTLQLLAASPEWLDPKHIHKITRREVYSTMLRSLWHALNPHSMVPAAVSSEYQQIG